VIEVSHQINAVERTVGRRMFRAGEVRTITITRTYDSPISDVWDACTKPERIPRWFLPVTGDLRTGGRYQLQGNAGGTIERCEPPRSFSASWEFGGQTSWIELRLSAASENATRFELEHIVPADDPKWAEFGPAAIGIGWDLGLMGLGEHVRSGESADPEAAAQWMASKEGREFIALSGESWRGADVQAGAEPADAEEAAHRTIAFYADNLSAG
jgi:uncharacterized protein YndB with AHSA1/START domain